MADPARTPVYIFAAYPAVRAGLFALLGDDPTLEPIAPEPVSLRRDQAAQPDRLDHDGPAVIVVDRSGIDDGALDEIGLPSVAEAVANTGVVLPQAGGGALAFCGSR